MTERDFIVFDLETSGLDVRRHEILEIGAVRVRSDLAAVMGEFSVRTIPLAISAADPEGLAVNGYTDEAWKDALPLPQALQRFMEFAKDGMLAGYNVAFDWSFLHAALNIHRIALTTDYHIFDVFSVAFVDALKSGPVEHWNLAAMSERYGLPIPPKPHRALVDARATLALLKAVLEKSSLV